MQFFLLLSPLFLFFYFFFEREDNARRWMCLPWTPWIFLRRKVGLPNFKDESNLVLICLGSYLVKDNSDFLVIARAGPSS